MRVHRTRWKAVRTIYLPNPNNVMYLFALHKVNAHLHMEIIDSTDGQFGEFISLSLLDRFVF